LECAASETHYPIYPVRIHVHLCIRSVIVPLRVMSTRPRQFMPSNSPLLSIKKLRHVL